MKILLITEENSAARLIKAVPKGIELIICTNQPNRDNDAKLWKISDQLGLECWSIDDENMSSFGNQVRERKIDILISFRSSRILRRSVLEGPTIAAFNLHTGPLPKYAGLNVPSWAIFNGEIEHGVTVHWMEPGIDTGPIALQSQFQISGNETGASLTGKCVRVGAELLVTLVEGFKKGMKVPRIEQDISLRKYYSKEIPNNGWIDWSWRAEEIDRFVRAAFFFPFPSPWGVPKAIVNGVEIAVLKAFRVKTINQSANPGQIISFGNDYIDVATSDDALRLTDILYQNERVIVTDIVNR